MCFCRWHRDSGADADLSTVQEAKVSGRYWFLWEPLHAWRCAFGFHDRWAGLHLTLWCMTPFACTDTCVHVGINLCYMRTFMQVFEQTNLLQYALSHTKTCMRSRGSGGSFLAQREREKAEMLTCSCCKAYCMAVDVGERWISDDKGKISIWTAR